MNHLRTKVYPYTWNCEGPNPVEGVMVRRTDDRAFMFLPYDQVIEVADRLVDIVEKAESRRARELTRPGTVGERFDGHADI